MKRRHPTGRGRIRSKYLDAFFNVLNYVPVDYGISASWLAYLRTAYAHYEYVLKRTAPDDLNANMFDAEIEAHVAYERRLADEQKANHFHVIRHHERLVRGELDRAVKLISDLESDLNSIDAMIENLKKGGDQL
ncbi:MAG: hypothetical protein IKI64_08845 [Clostridia bacterium]|nr:hypothetical protein [Clostridia bacterium]